MRVETGPIQSYNTNPRNSRTETEGDAFKERKGLTVAEAEAKAKAEGSENAEVQAR